MVCKQEVITQPKFMNAMEQATYYYHAITVIWTNGIISDPHLGTPWPPNGIGCSVSEKYQ